MRASISAAFGIDDLGELGGPRACWQRNEGTGALPEASVDDGGQVAGSGQVPLADRSSQDLPEVQAGEFRGAHGPPQPFRLVAWLLLVCLRQASQEQVLVPQVAGRAGLGGPDHVQDRQVVGVGQGLLPGLGGRQLLAIPI
jgi:hypothetical protein